MHALKPGSASILDHPAWQAAVNAPVVAETDEELEAVLEALKSGPVLNGAQVTAELSR